MGTSSYAETLLTMVQNFFVAFGIVLGASLLSGLYSILMLQPPTITMNTIAQKIKIWALIAALGGTIDPIRQIENHFYEGQISPAIKDILQILSAFVGAQLGMELIKSICGGTDV